MMHYTVMAYSDQTPIPHAIRGGATVGCGHLHRTIAAAGRCADAQPRAWTYAVEAVEDDGEIRGLTDAEASGTQW